MLVLPLMRGYSDPKASPPKTRQCLWSPRQCSRSFFLSCNPHAADKQAEGLAQRLNVERIRAVPCRARFAKSNLMFPVPQNRCGRWIRFDRCPICRDASPVALLPCTQRRWNEWPCLSFCHASCLNPCAAVRGSPSALGFWCFGRFVGSATDDGGEQSRSGGIRCR
jgi:hypothetical protein